VVSITSVIPITEKKVVCSATDHTLRLVNLESAEGQLMHTFYAHSAPVLCASYTGRLAGGSADGIVNVFQFEQDQNIVTLHSLIEKL
jgi:WD40 repeat protein